MNNVYDQWAKFENYEHTGFEVLQQEEEYEDRIAEAQYRAEMGIKSYGYWIHESEMTQPDLSMICSSF